MTGSRVRSVLFLQGLASAFFARLGRALTARGHAVHRVNFNGGDRLFWRLPGAVDYRGSLREWPDFLDRLLVEKSVSNIILFGDCRPVHRAAIPVALTRGVRVHVVEEGYLRPGWITFEKGGVNANSLLPRDPGWYREQAAALPPWRDAPALPGSFRARAVADVAYTLGLLAMAWRFPSYRTHRRHHPVVEYTGWVRRLAGRRRAERRAAAAIAELSSSIDPIFLFPLQLDGDTQIRMHSPFGAMGPAIEQVIASFARHAPETARLLVKRHPLDDGLVDWTRFVRHLAAGRGVADRLIIVDGGDIEAVVRQARAVVTVNSTVGTLALALGLPVIALGTAIYDLPGLTFQGALDDFWQAPTPPDRQLYDSFRRVLAARCLIPGDFFCEPGLRLAVAAAVARLEATDPRPLQRAIIAEPNAFADSAAVAVATQKR
jgi:capsular polysaccharide export protein